MSTEQNKANAPPLNKTSSLHEEFWAPYETLVNSFEEAAEIINGIFLEWAKKKRVFAWRGQANAAWSLHSSLYRHILSNTKPDAPTKEHPKEADLYRAEGKILVELHRWGLHHSETKGRLPVLHQLAVLQHYGSPTRLLDITFNAYVSLWFAVEETGDENIDNSDGRLFAIDVTNRLINERNDCRNWENDNRRPWREEEIKKEHDSSHPLRNWRTDVLAWRPPLFERRIAAQQGGFLLGGVPVSIKGDNSPLQWTKNPGSGNRWKIDQVREALSIAATLHKLPEKLSRGRRPQQAMYTIRITASAKHEIRERLKGLFGYTHSTMYPDFPGFSKFGISSLSQT